MAKDKPYLDDYSQTVELFLARSADCKKWADSDKEYFFKTCCDNNFAVFEAILERGGDAKALVDLFVYHLSQLDPIKDKEKLDRFIDHPNVLDWLYEIAIIHDAALSRSIKVAKYQRLQDLYVELTKKISVDDLLAASMSLPDFVEDAFSASSKEKQKQFIDGMIKNRKLEYLKTLSLYMDEDLLLHMFKEVRGTKYLHYISRFTKLQIDPRFESVEKEDVNLSRYVVENYLSSPSFWKEEFFKNCAAKAFSVVSEDNKLEIVKKCSGFYEDEAIYEVISQNSKWFKDNLFYVGTEILPLCSRRVVTKLKDIGVLDGVAEADFTGMCYAARQMDITKQFTSDEAIDEDGMAIALMVKEARRKENKRSFIGHIIKPSEIKEFLELSVRLLAKDKSTPVTAVIWDGTHATSIMAEYNKSTWHLDVVMSDSLVSLSSKRVSNANIYLNEMVEQGSIKSFKQYVSCERFQGRGLNCGLIAVKTCKNFSNAKDYLPNGYNSLPHFMASHAAEDKDIGREKPSESSNQKISEFKKLDNLVIARMPMRFGVITESISRIEARSDSFGSDVKDMPVNKRREKLEAALKRHVEEEDGERINKCSENYRKTLHRKISEFLSVSTKNEAEIDELVRKASIDGLRDRVAGIEAAHVPPPPSSSLSSCRRESLRGSRGNSQHEEVLCK